MNLKRKNKAISIHKQMTKPRKPLSTFFLLLLIPASLLAVALLHLVCRGLNILCIQPIVVSSILTFKELETPHGAKNQPKVSRKPNSNLTLLKQTSKSSQFSVRADNFFDGHDCGLRFFMTWISKPNSFSQRELLAIESLFKSHPNACLLLVSNTLGSSKGVKILQPLLHKGFQIATISPNFTFLFENTPVNDWFANLTQGAINPGLVSLGQNLSNLIRLALLYKYGGIYVDTDVIILKNLSGLQNAIGAQAVDPKSGNWSRLNNAVMIFEKGHPLLFKFMEEFAITFDGNIWGHNGPYLVSRVVARVGGFGITVLPPEAFYPVDWNRIQGLFQGPKSKEDAKWVRAKVSRIREESFGLHLWNRRSRDLEVEEGSVIERIVRDSCVICNFSRNVSR